MSVFYGHFRIDYVWVDGKLLLDNNNVTCFDLAGTLTRIEYKSSFLKCCRRMLVCGKTKSCNGTWVRKNCTISNSLERKTADVANILNVVKQNHAKLEGSFNDEELQVHVIVEGIKRQLESVESFVWVQRLVVSLGVLCKQRRIDRSNRRRSQRGCKGNRTPSCTKLMVAASDGTDFIH